MAPGKLTCVFFILLCPFSLGMLFQEEKSTAYKDVNEDYFKEQWNGKPSADPITKVHIIFMNHLDVGYSMANPPYINNILNMYFTKYFPRAISLGQQLLQTGTKEGFTYTTHPWVVDMYLNCPVNFTVNGVTLKCPSAAAIAQFTEAVKNGTITWHAGPMNMQLENMDASLFLDSMNISANLDRRFNITRKFKTLSQRDVPGLTRAAIPLLLQSGIQAVSVGSNDRAPGPGVPSGVFRWKYGTSEILATWHRGGYPDGYGGDVKHPGGLGRGHCAMNAGFSEAMCYAFRMDNSGPPESIKEIQTVYAIVKNQFPNAQAFNSRFEWFMEAISAARETMPVFTSEVGDTWIQGIPSDPRKLAEYRAVSRVLAKCKASGQCQSDDPMVQTAVRYMTKLAEHTWGMYGGIDEDHWTNEELSQVILSKNYQIIINTWIEQRMYTDYAVAAMAKHPIANELNAALQETRTHEPDLRNFKRLSMPTTPLTCRTASGNITIGFSVDGSISTLTTPWGSLASSNNPLAQFRYLSFNQTDIDAVVKTYRFPGQPDFTCFKKNGCQQHANQDSRTWPTTANAFYTNNASPTCDFWIHIIMMDQVTWTNYGAPKDVWVRYTVRTDPKAPGVDVDLNMFGKTATRIPEAMLMTFMPVPQKGHQWFISKLGNLIEPHNVAINGSQYQHAVDTGVYYVDPKTMTGLQFESLDVPLVLPSTADGVGPSPYPTWLNPITSEFTGMHFNIHNNIWETNYIFWYPYTSGDENLRSRFRINILPK